MRGFVASPAVLFKSGFHRTEVTTVIPQAFPFSAALFAALGSLTTAHGTHIFAHSCACYQLLLLMSHQGFPSVPSPSLPLCTTLGCFNVNFSFGRTLFHPCKAFMDIFEATPVHISVVYGRERLLSVNNQSKVNGGIKQLAKPASTGWLQHIIYCC